MEIISYFTKQAVPALHLTPFIQVWKVSTNGSEKTLAAAGTMTELGDGFYSFGFVPDNDGEYIVRTDGGTSLSAYERTNISTISSSLTNGQLLAIAENTWNYKTGSVTEPDTMGMAVNQIKTATEQITVSTAELSDVLAELLQYDANRYKIDKSACTMTIYEADGVTPFKVFNLRDSSGKPSIVEVTERIPV